MSKERSYRQRKRHYRNDDCESGHYVCSLGGASLPLGGRVVRSADSLKRSTSVRACSLEAIQFQPLPTATAQSTRF
jgi:hypothetical protein